MDIDEFKPIVYLKNILADKPWLFIIAYYVYTTPGLTIEELREIVELNTSVLKRGVWWLRKYGVVEEKNNKYYIRQEYRDPLGRLLLNHCGLRTIHILLLDQVYIVYYIRDGKIQYYSLPREYIDKLVYYERITGSGYTESDLVHLLGVSHGTARKILRLRELLGKCRERTQPRE